MMPLELFFKDNPRLEAAGIELLPIPTPVPTAGTPCDLKPSFVHWCFVVVLPLGSIPDFGRFYGSHGAVLPAVPCSPKTSLIAHANTSSPTDGLDGLDP